MTDYIEEFIKEKNLAQNSQSSYRYDLQAFAKAVGEPKDLTQAKVRTFEKSLSAFKPSAARRKRSTVNQYLIFLFRHGIVSELFNLPDVIRLPKNTTIPEKKDLSAFYADSNDHLGQVLVLLIVELGLTPSEILNIEVKNLDLEFKTLVVETRGKVRVLNLTSTLVDHLTMPEGHKQYFFEKSGSHYSRQWFFTHISRYQKELGIEPLTAQELREQYILRCVEEGVDIHELGRRLGLKSPITIEKYYAQD